MLKRARAYSPAGITSFFEICDKNADGTPIADPERVGALGGGFSPDKGVVTEVSVTEAEEKKIKVLINGESCPEAKTTKTVVDILTANVSGAYTVIVKHHVDVPIGAGFGSSAAGALGAALALSNALNLNFTYNELGKAAHVAEVIAQTGLGTAGPLLFGGCGLTITPGAPGFARLDRIPVSPDHRLVMGTFRPYLTKEMLSSNKKRAIINEWGCKTLKKILNKPSLKNFMTSCKEYALQTGFATERVRQLIELAENAGAIGAAQNMLGEAVHALVIDDSAEAVYDAFRKVLPEEKIILSSIDFQGARIIG